MQGGMIGHLSRSLRIDPQAPDAPVTGGEDIYSTQTFKRKCKKAMLDLGKPYKTRYLPTAIY
jgi:hypothetical protein